MANNLFISYDLIGADRDYEPVIKAIKELGDWGKLEYSFFYVKSTLSAAEAARHVWNSMHAQDKLLIIDSANNQFSCYNISAEVLKHMQNHWNK